MPLIAAGYCGLTDYKWISPLFVVIGVVGPVLHAFGVIKPSGQVIKGIRTASLLAIAVISVLFYKPGINISGVAGSLSVVIGAAVIGTEGRGFLGLANIDWLHFVLAAGVLVLAFGMK